MSFFELVVLHMPDQGNRPSEAERTETQEIAARARRRLEDAVCVCSPVSFVTPDGSIAVRH
jgi:hypothetical protein